MSYVWATVFGRDVGDSKKPLTLSGRYLSSWLAFLSLILVNVYVARLTADNVKDEPIKPFTSLHDPRVTMMHKLLIFTLLCFARRLLCDRNLSLVKILPTNL